MCIFAYGQTGSGKTFTMQGGKGDPSQRGIVQRAVSQIFKRLKENNEAEPLKKLTVSCYEIYIENVRDLLDP